jgi:hypothetical protein
MTNNANNDFERKVKSSLEGYEASFDPADWSDMENRLEAMPQHAPAFKWTFSMNVIVGIIACSALVFLVVKLSSSKNNASTEKPATEIITPVQSTSVPTVNTPSVKTKPVQTISETKEPNASGQDSQEDNTDKKAELTVQTPGPTPLNYDPTMGRRMKSDKNVAPVEAIQPSLMETDAQKVRIFPDMVDPKKGVIFNTKEKTGSDQSQTEVNVGWNDYVIYNPVNLPAKAGDSTKKTVAETGKTETDLSGQKSKTDRRSIFSRKSKHEKTSDQTTPPVTIPVTQDKPAPDNSSPPDAPPVKSDTLKKTRLKNPKYKDDHSILDPY